MENVTTFRVGDYVKCPYDGREYLGYITELFKTKASVRICLSSKKSDPIFDTIDADLEDLSFPIKQNSAE